MEEGHKEVGEGREAPRAAEGATATEEVAGAALEVWLVGRKAGGKVTEAQTEPGMAAVEAAAKARGVDWEGSLDWAGGEEGDLAVNAEVDEESEEAAQAALVEWVVAGQGAEGAAGGLGRRRAEARESIQLESTNHETSQFQKYRLLGIAK